VRFTFATCLARLHTLVKVCLRKVQSLGAVIAQSFETRRRFALRCTEQRQRIRGLSLITVVFSLVKSFYP
jgi:hypothetical protein